MSTPTPRRDKVAELLAKWNWEARPLRPKRSTYQGKFWDVGAAVKLPSLILPTADGDVTLSLKKTRAEPEKMVGCVQASTRTLNLMHTGSERPSSSSDGKDADAWMNGGDPWSAYRATVAPAATTLFPENRQKPCSETQSKFQQLQQQVENLAEQLKHKEDDEDMKNEDSTVAMEIEELKAQHGKYEQWFHSAGSRMANIEGHMQKQATQIQELGIAVQSQSGATTKLQQKVEVISKLLWTSCLRRRTRGSKPCLRKGRRPLDYQGVEAQLVLLHATMLLGFGYYVYGWSVVLVRSRLERIPIPPLAVEGIDVTLGSTINVAGLSTTFDLTASLAPGLWGCTETQLSGKGQQYFNAAFRKATSLQHRHVRMIHGAPAPPRCLDSDAGAWTGVLAFSDFPTRPVKVQWQGAGHSLGWCFLQHRLEIWY